MKKLENQNIEYKQSWHDGYLKWICGFANNKSNIKTTVLSFCFL